MPPPSPKHPPPEALQNQIAGKNHFISPAEG